MDDHASESADHPTRRPFNGHLGDNGESSSETSFDEHDQAQAAQRIELRSSRSALYDSLSEDSEARNSPDTHLEPASIDMFSQIGAQNVGPAEDEVLAAESDFSPPERPERESYQAVFDMFSTYDGDHTNFPFMVFYLLWRLHWNERFPHIPHMASMEPMEELCGPDQRSKKILPKDVAKGICDEQGIPWTRYGMTKDQARQFRRFTYKNHRNVSIIDKQIARNMCSSEFTIHFRDAECSEIVVETDIFEFREMHTEHKPLHPHYQLRHNIVATSTTSIFYNKSSCSPASDLARPGENAVKCYDPMSTTARPCLDARQLGTEASIPLTGQVTCINANENMLVAGNMAGGYAIKDLATEYSTSPIIGSIASASVPESMRGSLWRLNSMGINHIEILQARRSGLPQAVFTANDLHVRILDCTTNRWIAGHRFSFAPNCSVTSPDGRLRLIVLDDCQPVVADADTGERLARLNGHDDHGFACAWSQDGFTMATGHQDGIVQVWDARSLNKSVMRIPCEQAGVRSMAFSPLNGDPQVLVLAEAADFVHILNLSNPGHMQTIDFFGEIGGISFTPDGQSLWIANDDQGFGGLMEYRRSNPSRNLFI